MQVYKFGGASISSIDRIKEVVNITREGTNTPLLVVVSAMGKTTNALEKVAEAFFAGQTDTALALFEQIKKQHQNMAKYLLVRQQHAFSQQFTDLSTEAEWLLYDKPVRDYAYYYDQIVCLGELFSSALLHHTLLENKIPNQWVDVRDVLRTDQNFREAIVVEPFMQKAIQEQVVPLLKENGVVVTQGFIGSTDDNESTTLGREGSDYTAALFAAMLPASQLTIWKDVNAVLNADPKLFKEVTELPQLSYNEVVEMAYYGAQIIHPKTLKPVYNSGIPLQVKSFLNPQLPGTLIHHKNAADLPPIFIKKFNQVLMSFTTQDFAFIGEEPIRLWYDLLKSLHLKPNLIQYGAVKLMAVLDDHPEKITELALQASALFEVQIQRQLSLFTVKHYNNDSLVQHIEPLHAILKQQTVDTIQVLYAEDVQLSINSK